MRINTPLIPLGQARVPILADAIRAAGSDHLPTFGGDYEGGYHIQQVPMELACLVYLLQRRDPFKASLEIGIAAGGTTRFIREQVEIGFTAIIDDGKHPKWPVWTESNSHHCKPLAQYVGDSHGPGAAEFLRWLDVKFDLVAVDGDHSFEGVRQDWELVHPYLATDAIVWFHDIQACEGVARLWAELSRRYEVLGQFIHDTPERKGLGIGAIRV